MKTIWKLFCCYFLFISAACWSKEPSLIDMFEDKDKKPSLEEVKSAIKLGADVNAISKGNDVLSLAAGTVTDPEIILELFKAGAIIHQEIEHPLEVTPLMSAALHNDNPEIIEMLVRIGIPINAMSTNGFNALMCAASDNANVEIIETLLDSGADVYAKSVRGRTVMMPAIENPNPNVISILAKAGARVNATDINGMSPLQMAVESKNFRAEVVERLVESGAEIYPEIVRIAVIAAIVKKNPEIVIPVIKLARADFAMQSFARKVAISEGGSEQLLKVIDSAVDKSAKGRKRKIEPTNALNTVEPFWVGLFKIGIILVIVVIAVIFALFDGDTIRTVILRKINGAQPRIEQEK